MCGICNADDYDQKNNNAGHVYNNQSVWKFDKDNNLKL